MLVCSFWTFTKCCTLMSQIVEDLQKHWSLFSKLKIMCMFRNSFVIDFGNRVNCEKKLLWVAFKFQSWFWGKWSWYKHVINVCLHGNLIGFLHRRVKWFREKFLGVVFVMIKIFSKCNHESEHAINLNKSVFLLPIELNIVYYHRKYYWWWLPFFSPFCRKLNTDESTAAMLWGN